MNTKVCSICKQEKPVNLFYRDKTTSDGRRPFCKTCHKAKYTKGRVIYPPVVVQRLPKVEYHYPLEKIRTTLPELLIYLGYRHRESMFTRKSDEVTKVQQFIYLVEVLQKIYDAPEPTSGVQDVDRPA